MKKVFITLAVMFIIGIGCKKNLDPGGGPCACSPVTEAYFSLSIKSSNGSDLLNATNTGAFTKDQIQLYYKDAQGVSKPVEFSIRPPFSTPKTAYAFNQIFSTTLAEIARGGNNIFFLKLGNRPPMEMNVKVIGTKTERLLIDQTEVPLETSVADDDFYIKSIFSLKL
ncbi:hypothetical protein GJU39_02185 [Pedobacter petrophilus]|uniref:Uncharacterized protein n=1 Tax=Pedobacter petrophilus TaxID=1908241 RepID=A0A7K0FUZ9_9SPHI|nr:hypothetical protein [Pedobacter petrophilus]MRX74884.1 hypothetical protein [Pedobacter petrophilus]